MKSKKSRIIFWVVVGVSVAILLAILFSQLLSVQYTKVSITKFNELIVAGKINQIHVDGYVLKGTLVQNGQVVGGVGYETVGDSLYGTGGIAAFQQWLIEGYGVSPDVVRALTIKMEDPNAGSVWSTVFTIGSIVIVALIFWLMMRSAAGGGAKTMNIGKTKAHVQNNLKVRFADVAGAEEEKEELQEVVEFLKQPRKFSDLGARIPRGVLLVGPPGTGKTLFAKAVAGEAGVPFFSVSGSDFVEMYVGVGAARVRDLFDVAKKNQPCIIFVDEIDAVGRRRGAGLGGGHDEREQTLNQILVQMDGFETNEGIIVMAATNRADILDPALLRPGRFDRQINVNLPDVKGREQILKVHARNKPISPDVNFKTVARMTVGFSGADLANLLNEAAILTARANKKLIGNVELYESIDKVLMGLKKKSHVVTEADKRITAYHEAGHAVLAGLCKHCDPVHEVTVVPRGNGAGGFTMTRPDEDTSYYSYNKLVDDICMSLGGRAAEELVIKDITTGASADLQHVSDRARRMVKQWGMSEKLGLVAYDTDQPVFVGMEYEYGGGSRNSYSQETAAEIDREVRNLINSAYERAKKLLSENRSILDNMSRVLVERETIYTEEVEMLMRGASYTEVLAYMDSEESGVRKDNPFARFEDKKSEETATEAEPQNTDEKTDENTESKE